MNTCCSLYRKNMAKGVTNKPKIVILKKNKSRMVLNFEITISSFLNEQWKISYCFLNFSYPAIFIINSNIP